MSRLNNFGRFFVSAFVTGYVFYHSEQVFAREPLHASYKAEVPYREPESVLIPAGEFYMGMSDDEVKARYKDYRDELPASFANEQPQRPVHLDDFWIGRYEVTVGEYALFCEAMRRKMPYAPDFDPKWERKNHPIVNVNYIDAKDYCKWLSRVTKKRYRLPTEAEWEKAARGIDQRMYPWGNEWDASKCANSISKKLKSTPPIGSYPDDKSPYGVMDMAGSVAEWCSDWYGEDYYKKSPQRNPKGPKRGKSRVVRGGAWEGVYGSRIFRCTHRQLCEPLSRVVLFGFRCVLVTPSSAGGRAQQLDNEPVQHRGSVDNFDRGT